jgi:hypothetical protein
VQRSMQQTTVSKDALVMQATTMMTSTFKIEIYS